MADKRVADVLVDTLVAAGVKRVYGLVGDSLNGVTDSIRPRKDLQWVPVRHEETAAFNVRRRRCLDVDGRLADASSIESAGQSRRVQERLARLR